MLDDLALGRGRLDRLADRRADPVWFASVCADPETFVVGVSGADLAMDGDSLRNLSGAPLHAERAALLGTVSGRVHVALMHENLIGARSLREVGAILADDQAALATTAVALHQWHRHHTHCARCGRETVSDCAGWERRCAFDGSAHFPRTDPAVIVVVTDDDDRLLLARQQTWPEHRFSLVAGYVEPGETAEHAVSREVLEEVGVPVQVVTYLGSQPWPFPASLMLCYHARALSGQIAVDGVEIAEAAWFTRFDLQESLADGSVILPSRVSIARRAIERWFGSPLAD